MTDSSYAHLSILPAAVEAAQRTAAEYVAQALAAAEAAGYARGLASAEKAAPKGLRVDSRALASLLARATEVLSEIDQGAGGISPLCDDLTVAARRAGRMSESITVPDTNDSFSEIESFLEEHGGNDLISVDDAEVDSDEIREAANTLVEQASALRELLDKIHALLGDAPVEGDETETDATEAA